MTRQPEAAPPLTFQVTADMVDRFAALTGDRSSLHMDPVFARRSPYRHRVAHGMLPLMYLAGIRPEPVSPPRRIESLTARFTKPVFLGDTLALELEPRESESPALSTFSYSISRGSPREIVTMGTVSYAARHASSGSLADGSESSTPMCLVRTPLEESTSLIHDLAKGDNRELDVSISESHRAALEELLAVGTKGTGQQTDPTVAAALLQIATSSTYVGMCVPGRHATYLEFSATWTDAEAGSDLRFLGEVTLVSPSTGTVASRFTIDSIDETQSAQVVCHGTIKSRVNEPPHTMPSFTQLTDVAQDLGLRDRVVLVTGASRGIGETVAKLFAAHGARVAVNYWSGESDAESIVAEIVAGGGVAMAVQGDVRDETSVESMAEAVVRELGPIEILVNNAAGDFASHDFLSQSWSHVQRDLDIIARGAFNCCQAVLPGMRAQGFGRIVNLSTVAVENPPQGHVAYVMAKSALVGLTRSLAVEYAADGILVNMVTPTLVETDLTSHMSPMVREGLRRAAPMKRHATPVDVANAVVFLASNLAEYTSGQQIPVTGGRAPFL